MTKNKKQQREEKSTALLGLLSRLEKMSCETHVKLGVAPRNLKV
jgi:hypothetical protein